MSLMIYLGNIHAYVILENVNTENYLVSLIKYNNLTQVEDLMLQSIQLHKMPDVLDALCVQSKKYILSLAK